MFWYCCWYLCVSRLAEECASDPVLKENTFTAPSKKSRGPDSLESLCQCLLRCCDSLWIPTVVVSVGRAHTRVHCKRLLHHLI